MSRWHIVMQIGTSDNFFPELPTGDGHILVAIDKPGHPSGVANQILSRVHAEGFVPSPRSVDLLNIALATYTADLRVWRGYSEDRWTRDFVVYAPVGDPASWSATLPLLHSLLTFLTGDRWEIVLREKSEQHRSEEPQTMEQPRPDIVSLFSGGLDSFVGAIDLLAGPARIALVGQYGNSRNEQQSAYEALERVHADRITPFWFHVLPPLGRDLDGKKRQGEDTMRSRSLLFFALGTAVASAIGNQIPLYIPENGLISLNVPLTPARMGSSSTRTTHPYVIKLYRELLSACGIAVPVMTPYRFVTKGEMLANARNPALLAAGVHETMSCARPSMGRQHRLEVGIHCGYCVPCIIRRAALRVVGMDTETHHFDILTGDATPRETRGADRRAFEMAIERTRTMRPLQLVSEVVSSGPIEPDEIDSSVGVFRRGLDEVTQFLNS
jgi:7-cyano-7-deazaguanine synthase in queuosine biosynthesis